MITTAVICRLGVNVHVNLTSIPRVVNVTLASLTLPTLGRTVQQAARVVRVTPLVSADVRMAQLEGFVSASRMSKGTPATVVRRTSTTSVTQKDANLVNVIMMERPTVPRTTVIR